MTARIMQHTEPLPGYRLVERLGRGGYGEVWKAEAPGGLFKAIKFVFGDLDQAGGEDNRAAEQELKALNRVKSIRHPFILSIERFDIIEGQLMIVMELADRNLWDRYHECRTQGLPGIPRDELLRYMDEAAEALDLMNFHYQIQHLDIKPQNLFLIHNHIKVADFGLAKDFEGIRATVTGGVTPVYAAPETFEGWISRFCDQYSFAIVYQELLTGVRPFNGTNTRQLLMQHISAAPDVSSLPAKEQPIVARALSKKPDERHPSCTEFVRAIRESAQASAVAINANPAQPRSGAETAKTIPNFRQAKGGDTAAAQPLATPANPSSGNRPSSFKGLPPLVTPGAVASSSSVRPPSSGAASAGSGALTLQRPIAFETGRIGRLGIAPPEKLGAGVLYPVYLVAVGKVGLAVMQHTRAILQERFGRRAFPHWKWFFIDTDPETVTAATKVGTSESLDAAEAYLARLHRPAHYLKHDALPPPETWMSNEQLYRMPREPATNGVRSLGRLALCDHFLNLTQKIRQDLESFISDDILVEADRQTGLGIRSNRPRVYLACSIAGGTGSGMLIDLAYLIRSEMRQLGYLKPLLTGILLTPSVDRSAPKTLPTANACATLKELNHFSLASTRFEARYDLRQPSIADPERPFERCVLLSMQRSRGSKSPPAPERAAELICQESLTPLGRAMDETRATYQSKHGASSMPVQSFGYFRIAWPRRRMLDVATERFAARILQRWCSKDTEPLRKNITAWFEEQWGSRQLEPMQIASTLENALTVTFGEPPIAFIDAEIRAFIGSPDNPSKLELKDHLATFERLLDLVGKPGREEDILSGRISNTLETISKPISKDSEIKFAKLAVHFIEQPFYRLAGAEETIRQCTARLQKLIDQQEEKWKQLSNELDNEFPKLLPLLETIAQSGYKLSRRPGSFPEMLGPLRSWACKRYHQLLQRCVWSIYRRMLGHAPEYLREVTHCRTQLSALSIEMSKSAENNANPTASKDQPMLPTGCHNLLESADRLIDRLQHDAVVEFEEGLQHQIRRKCRALVSACLSFKESGQRLKEVILEQSRQFMNARLEQHTPAEDFFRNRRDEHSAGREILKAYDECEPETFGLLPRAEARNFLLGVSNDEHGVKLTEMARELIPEKGIIAVPTTNEIVFYSENHDLPIAKLPHSGSVALESAREVMNKDKIDSHCRTDVNWSPVQS